MYRIQTTDGDLIASFTKEGHMTSFYKTLTESKEPEYLTMDLVMLWDKPDVMVYDSEVVRD